MRLTGTEHIRFQVSGFGFQVSGVKSGVHGDGFISYTYSYTLIAGISSPNSGEWGCKSTTSSQRANWWMMETAPGLPSKRPIRDRDDTPHRKSVRKSDRPIRVCARTGFRSVSAAPAPAVGLLKPETRNLNPEGERPLCHIPLIGLVLKIHIGHKY